MRAAVRLLPLPPEAFRSLRVEGTDVIIKTRHGRDAWLAHAMDQVFPEDCSGRRLRLGGAGRRGRCQKRRECHSHGLRPDGHGQDLHDARRAGRTPGRPVPGMRASSAAASLFEAWRRALPTARSCPRHTFLPRVWDASRICGAGPSNAGAPGAGALEPRIRRSQRARALGVPGRVGGGRARARRAGTKGRATRAAVERTRREATPCCSSRSGSSPWRENDENRDPARWSQFAASDVPPSTAQTPGWRHAHGGSPREALARGPGWV